MIVVFDIVLMALLIGGLIVAQRMSARRERTNEAASKARGNGDPVGPPAGARPAKTARHTPAQLAPLAAGLSFLVPGAGHFLIRAPLRGLIWLVGWVVVGALSGASHSPIVFVLMFAAAVDAFLAGRWSSPPDGPETPTQAGSTSR